MTARPRPRTSGACLVVVTRAPGSKGAKTRLAEGVGPQACLRLQEAFLADTLAWAHELTATHLVSVYPPEATAEVARRAPGWTVVGQSERDFGERMRGAVNAGFAAGGAPVAMVATDSPTLPAERVQQAWAAVGAPEGVEVALAPAQDGGWVMIAAAAPLPEGCFDGVRWSARDTLEDTRAACERQGLRVGLLDPWYDVDTAADLERMAADVRSGSGRRVPHSEAALAAIGVPARRS